MDATGEDQRLELVKQMREHEVAVAELSSLSSNRAVYQKHGIIYFRTATHKAKASEQKLLDQTKEKMQKLNSP
uniref:Uncharacterized protein n=1 Tax=Kalanchoe fedtschenkoi TaxID=63787 RepID=A0A7N0UJF1_KALFE